MNDIISLPKPVPRPNFLTADLHLGTHPGKFQIRGRKLPCFGSSTQVHDDYIIDKFNQMVAPLGADAVTWFVGDIVDQCAGVEFLRVLERLSGRKVLFRGNHDDAYSDGDLAPYFERIIPKGEGEVLMVNGTFDTEEAEVTVSDLSCWTQHFPNGRRPDMFNLCAHVNGTWTYQADAYNVGVDANQYYPVPVADLAWHYHCATVLFQEEVAIGCKPINAAYLDSRGVQGHYCVKNKKGA